MEHIQERCSSVRQEWERHIQLDAEMQGRSSKISPSMACRNDGEGARLSEKSRENQGVRFVEVKECW